MNITCYDLTGTKVKDITLDKTIFGAKVNDILMAQAVRIYLANQRLASARSLTRADVDRTRKKLYRQKGTGGARHGDRKSPIFVGGGKAHGPKLEQNFDLNFPKKMKKVALKSALTVRMQEKSIIALAESKLNKPSAKQAATFIATVYKPEEQRKVALIIGDKQDVIAKSFRNLKAVSYYRASDLTTYDVLQNYRLLVTEEGLTQLVERLQK